jgi:hypothetical protein
MICYEQLLLDQKFDMLMYVHLDVRRYVHTRLAQLEESVALKDMQLPGYLSAKLRSSRQ